MVLGFDEISGFGKRVGRVSLALLGLLAAAGFGWAQTEPQTGMVRLELQAPGLTASHPRLPVGSRARVTHSVTGDAVEVTIIEPPSGNPLPEGWVVDVSPAAALALNVTGGETVTVTTVDAAFNVPVSQQPPVRVAAELPPAAVVVPEPMPPVPFSAPMRSAFRPVLDLDEVVAAREASGLALEGVRNNRPGDAPAVATALNVLEGALTNQAAALNALAKVLTAWAEEGKR